MRRGLVIGKFYPPHLGHKFLIDTATASCGQVDVVVCVRPDQTIPGPMRVRWLQEMCPAVNVLEVEDICDDDNSERWAQYVKQILGRTPDIVFTSEDYGVPFAKYLGCEHVLVDRARSKFSVSGTLVRNEPFKFWEFLHPCVRAHYVRRVCVLGAESTGTTTMARELAKELSTVWVPEYGRDYAESKLPVVDQNRHPSYEWKSKEFEHIAIEQAKREDAIAREANRVLICDTDALATSVWHERYMGFRSQAVERIARSRSYDLYLLTDCDIPFEQDGTRDGEKVREWMTQRFEEQLEFFGRKWMKLSGSRATRLKKAKDAVSTLISRPTDSKQ